jgi:predicted adenylyl cyclase CyaB
MKRNVEIKAALVDLQSTETVVRGLADGAPEILEQVDTFYHCESGRLKLRERAGAPAELIAYHRPDQDGPKTSQYVLVPVPEPQQLDLALAATLGRRGVVRKTRRLYMIGQTRVHLDRVADLGDFLELEVVLSGGQTEADGQQIAQRIMAQLHIDADHLLDRAYIDLLES